MKKIRRFIFTLFLLSLIILSNSKIQLIPKYSFSNLKENKSINLKITTSKNIKSKNNNIPNSSKKIKESFNSNQVNPKRFVVKTPKAKKTFNLNSNSTQVINYVGKKLYINKKDIDLMAKVVRSESESEPFKGKIAVASVILNRTINPEFPNTIESVIKERGAFSCVDKNGNVIKNADKSSYDAVMKALQGKDPTNKALFFYNPKIATSRWMKNANKNNKKNIGNHVFFNIS